MSRTATPRLHVMLRASVVGLVSALLWNGCSSTTPTIACDPATCAANNQCIEEKGETRCRRLCATQLECPFNYTCAPHAAGAYCSPNAAQLTERAGAWGTSCNPSKAPVPNADCDVSQSFFCFAENPTDAQAYCTRRDCMADADCAGGFTCATVNKLPDATSATRSVKDTIRACKKREYCDSCETDLDCPKWGSRATHCVSGDAGKHFCSVECDTTEACNNEATCTALPGITTPVCVPRAGTCVGDGSLCAPCRSDADCPAGLCAKTQYSTERFCTKKSAVPCAGGNGDCPTTLASGNKAGCAKETDPWWLNQCVGLISFASGGQTIAGCVTPGR